MKSEKSQSASIKTKGFTELEPKEKDATVWLEKSGVNLKPPNLTYVGSMAVHFYKEHFPALGIDEIELKIQCQVTKDANNEDLSVVRNAGDALMRFYEKKAVVRGNETTQ